MPVFTVATVSTKSTHRVLHINLDNVLYVEPTNEGLAITFIGDQEPRHVVRETPYDFLHGKAQSI